MVFRSEILLQKGFLTCRMLTSAHILAGGAIGKRLKWPHIALVLAFGSHFVLDRIPHVDAVSLWGLGSLKSDMGIAIDTLAGAVLVLALAGGQRRMRWILWGGVAAAIVDVIVMIPLWFPETANLPVVYHLRWLHCAAAGDVPPSSWLLGLATQALTIALAILILWPRSERTKGIRTVPVTKRET